METTEIKKMFAPTFIRTNTQTHTHTYALISHNTGPFDVGGTFSHLLPSEQGSFPFELLISFAPPPLCVCEEARDRDRERENVSQA